MFECVVHPQEVLGGLLNLPDGIYVWKSFVGAVSKSVCILMKPNYKLVLVKRASI